MPRLNHTELRTLNRDESIIGIQYMDGVVSKMELKTAGNDKYFEVFIGDEDVHMSPDQVKRHDVRVGEHLRGFFIDYSIPDDGATVFYPKDFHSK